MSIVLIGASLYFTYYTIMQGITIWKKENKFAGVVVFLLASLFLPICIWLLYH